MFELTDTRLREVLHYSPESGVFTWRVTNSRRKVAGSVAGCKHKRDGRIYIGIDGRLYKAHRLAWLYVHSEWPPAGVDHRDGVPDHNWIDNLRPASQAENMQNMRGPTRQSTTGLLGAYRSRGKFVAMLRIPGSRRIVGKRRDTAEEAHADYLAMKAIHHPFSTITGES